MRSVVVTEFVGTDGVMEDPGGGEAFDRGGWAFQFDRGRGSGRQTVRPARSARRAGRARGCPRWIGL